MSPPYLLIIFFGYVLLVHSNGQRTSSIPKLLQNCYKDNYINRMPQPPQTVQLLVELLRKLEFGKGNALNMRILTTSLLHAVRLDGVIRTSPYESEYTIPFRANGYHFYKYKLLVDYFTSGESSLFPDDTVTTYELCILHRLISNTLEFWERGDEKNTCPQERSMPSNKDYRNIVYTAQMSDCPIERGVVHTKWGPISPSHIIGGIASALQETRESFATISRRISVLNEVKSRASELKPTVGPMPINPMTITPMTIPLTTLTAMAVEPVAMTNKTIDRNVHILSTPWHDGSKNVININESNITNDNKTIQSIPTKNIKVGPRFRTEGSVVSNVWLSTVIGDVSEVVLNQAFHNPIIANPPLWNDTLYPRALYLAEDEWDLSQAELLGGIDGAIIAGKIKEWLNILDRTRLSQIFDMYYSTRGIGYDNRYRACERKSKLPSLFEDLNFSEEVSCVANLIQQVGNFRRVITADGIDLYTEQVTPVYHKAAAEVTKSFDNCEFDDFMLSRLEIIVILDGTWHQYEAERILSYLVEQADVSYYGSSIGVINGQTGAWMTNVTSDIVQLFFDLSEARKTWPSSLSLGKSLSTIALHYQNKTKAECGRNKKRPVGKVILVLANKARIGDTDAQNADWSISSIKKSNPEVKIVYATMPDNVRTFQKFLKTQYANDAVVEAKDARNLVGRVIEKIRNTPAHILNIYCNDSTSYLEDYLTPEIPTVYEVDLNYVAQGEVSVKFKGHDYSDKIIICAYSTVENKLCKGIAVNDEVSFNVRDHCSVEYACSVRFSILANNTKIKCSELDCRFPDQVRIDISTQIESGSATTLHNLFILLQVMLVYVLL